MRSPRPWPWRPWDWRSAWWPAGATTTRARARSAPTSAAAAPTVTSFDGAVCSAREPDPPADPQTYDAPPPQTIDVTKVYRATLETACGDIVIRLDPKRAPRTVNNFVFLAREGFYDGLTFHRIVAAS